MKVVSIREAATAVGARLLARTIVLVISVAFWFQAGFVLFGFVDKFSSSLVDERPSRSLSALRVRHADLGTATLGKLGHLLERPIVRSVRDRSLVRLQRKDLRTLNTIARWSHANIGAKVNSGPAVAQRGAGVEIDVEAQAETDTISQQSVKVPEAFIRRLQDVGISSLTLLQEMAIEKAMRGGPDIVVHAETGSGKTLCFAIPLLLKLNIPGKGLQGLVIAPTFALAAQIARVLNSLQPGAAVAFDRDVEVLPSGFPALPTAPILVSPPEQVLQLLGFAQVAGKPKEEDLEVALKRCKHVFRALRVVVLDEVDALPFGGGGKWQRKKSLHLVGEQQGKYQDVQDAQTNKLMKLARLEGYSKEQIDEAPDDGDLKRLIIKARKAKERRFSDSDARTLFKARSGQQAAATLIYLLRSMRESGQELQVLAASATAGTGLRRILHKIWGRELEVVRRPNVIWDPDVQGYMQSKKNPASPGTARDVSLPAGVSLGVVITNQQGLVKKLREVLNLENSVAPLFFIDPSSDLDDEVQRYRKAGFDAMSLEEAVLKQEAITPHFAPPPVSKAHEGGLPRLFVARPSDARGLDLHGIDLVVIRGVPQSADAFVHLAGRTARMGASGSVVMICTKQEYNEHAKPLSKRLGLSLGQNTLDLESDPRIENFQKRARIGKETTSDAFEEQGQSVPASPIPAGTGFR